MRHLRKYNEDIKTINFKDMTTWGSTEEPEKQDPPIDGKYFDLVFADFIDNGSESKFSENDNIYEINILKIDFDGDGIDDYIKYLDEESELVKDIKSCIGKIKLEYPKINVFFRISGGFDEIGGRAMDSYYRVSLYYNYQL